VANRGVGFNLEPPPPQPRRAEDLTSIAGAAGGHDLIGLDPQRGPDTTIVGAVADRRRVRAAIGDYRIDAITKDPKTVGSLFMLDNKGSADRPLPSAIPQPREAPWYSNSS
jgi:hypothetical protein